MLKLASWDETYPTSVRVSVPQLEGHAEVECTMRLRCLPTDEFPALVARGDHQVVRRCVSGLDRGAVADPDGNEVVYSPDALKALSNVP